MKFARAAAMVALVAFGVAGGWAVARLGTPDPSLAELAAESYRAHSTYAVEVLHPVEVLAADRAHLTTWLSKRIGQPINIPEFTDYGYRLLGGRVVPDTSGAAALLMYENDAGQRITLYVVQVKRSSESAFRFAQNGATGQFWWFGDNLGCAVVGDLPRDTLRAIAMAAYKQLTTN